MIVTVAVIEDMGTHNLSESSSREPTDQTLKSIFCFAIKT